MTRILFVPDRDRSSPVARLRAHAVAEELGRRGHEVQVAANHVPALASMPAKALGVLRTRMALAKAFRALRRDDVLYLVRIQDIPGLPGQALAAARRVGCRVVFDFDDAVHLTHPRSTQRLTRTADLVVVGSRGLEEYARSNNPSCLVVPTAFDPKEYPGPSPDEKPVVGWSGTPSNLPFLSSALPGISPALDAAGATLRIVTDISAARALPWPKGTELVQWDLSTYRQEIARFHVGVSPLPDLAWTRGKLGFKVIEYQACGVPAVGSPVLAKDEVLVEGETGFLVDTAAEWTKALTRLLLDRALRSRMSAAAREHALRRFAIRPVVDTLEAALRRTFGL